MTLEEIVKYFREMKQCYGTSVCGAGPELPLLIDDLVDAAERSIKLEAENKILRSEFEYLADIENYQSPSSGFALQYDPEKSNIEKRGGALTIARDVLEKINQGNKK